MKIGISACLLGQKVRYDGGNRLDHYISDTLGRYFTFVPVCPEVQYGLPVPREKIRLHGDPNSPRLVTIDTKVDHTTGMAWWIVLKLRELEKEELSAFVFKTRSSSCGLHDVKVFDDKGSTVGRGLGLFARAFVEMFPLVPVEDEERLRSMEHRESFIDKIFACRRWRKFLSANPAKNQIVPFHTDMKLVFMSHSIRHYKEAGRLVSDINGLSRMELFGEYGKILMDALSYRSTPNKHANVLHHIMGYFKKVLSPEEKQELVDVIGQYRNGYLPLVVPITLLKYYAKKFDEPYLKHQAYLNPSQEELMLRNHA